MSAVAPGPKGWRVLLEAPQARQGVLPYFVGLSRRYDAPLLHIALEPFSTYLPNHPDTLREVLVEKPTRFSRGRWWGDLLRLVGEGLLTSDEAAWVGQRRRLNPAYRGGHRGAVEAATADALAACAERWRATEGGVVDVQQDMKRVLLRALVDVMFSPDADVDEDQVIADLDVLVRYASFGGLLVRHALGLVGLPGPGRARMLAAVGRLDAWIDGLIVGGRSGRLRAGLLLAALLPAEARGEVGPAALHDEIGTLLLAGFDTTAALVSFGLWALADRPDLCDRIRAEADADAQPALDGVIRETLRLYPPVWAIHRTVAEPMEVAGVPVRKGDEFLISPFAIQRNPAFWPDPEAFRPERFAAGGAEPGLEYLPFSYGRHTCIGKRMALQQARLLLRSAVVAFDFARTRPLRLAGSSILRAEGGLPLRVTPR